MKSIVRLGLMVAREDWPEGTKEDVTEWAYLKILETEAYNVSLEEISAAYDKIYPPAAM